jgi:hypothetical protein
MNRSWPLTSVRSGRRSSGEIHDTLTLRQFHLLISQLPRALIATLWLAGGRPFSEAPRLLLAGSRTLRL